MKKLRILIAILFLIFISGTAFAIVENLEIPPKQYTGNGVTTDFPITFDYSGESDLTVSFVNDSDGSIDVWTQDASGDQGYTIVDDEVIANTAPDDGRLVIDGETPLTQTLNLKNNRATPAELYESALDKGILATRDVKAILDRAMVAPATADPDVDYTAPEYEASSFWQWDPTQKELRNTEILSGATTGIEIGDVVKLIDDDSGNGVFPASTISYIPQSTKTDDYTITTSDIGKLFVLGSATTSDKSFTLPPVGDSENGFIARGLNLSNHKLTVTPSDTDSVWNSGAGYGIETVKPGAYYTLRYDHSTTSWQPLQIGGGLWAGEGLKLWSPCTELTNRGIDLSTSNGGTPDLSGRNMLWVINGVSLNITSNNYPASLLITAADEYFNSNYSIDWDIFSDDTSDITVFARVRFANGIGSTESIIAQYEDANNLWFLSRHSTGTLRFVYRSATTTFIDISGGGLSANIWYDVSFIRVGTACGIYINGAQVGFDNTWTEDILLGDLFTGQLGDGSLDATVLINDILITHSNQYNAAPVVGETDIIAIPENLNLVTGGNR